MTLLVDGFDSPVGAPMERMYGTVWPGSWVDATPFGTKFTPTGGKECLHQGADLNRPHDADAHSPVYAVAHGQVTFAADPNYGGFGGNIVIRHWLSRTACIYSRYEHVEHINVTYTQWVLRGQQIAAVGNAHGLFAYHLHFDISITDTLRGNPLDWVPSAEPDKLRRDYADPKAYLTAHRPPKPIYMRVGEAALRIRETPAGVILRTLTRGERLLVQGITVNTLSPNKWARVVDPSTYATRGYVAVEYLSPEG